MRSTLSTVLVYTCKKLIACVWRANESAANLIFNNIRYNQTNKLRSWLQLSNCEIIRNMIAETRSTQCYRDRVHKKSGMDTVFRIHHFPQQLLNRKTARKIYWRKNKVGAEKNIYPKCTTEVLLKRIYNVFRE